MPNPTMRDARQAALSKPAAPTPVFTTDSNGNRSGDRPRVGPADPATIHNALKAQEAIASSPRPVAQSQIGATPADSSDSPTRDLRVSTAADRLANRQHQVASAIDEQSQ